MTDKLVIVSDVCVEVSAELGVVEVSQGVNVDVDVDVSDWVNIIGVTSIEDEAPVELAVYVEEEEETNETPEREVDKVIKLIVYFIAPLPCIFNFYA